MASSTSSTGGPKRRPLVIYHGNCADGFTAAWAFHQSFGDAYDYLAGVYQQPTPDVIDRDVYLMDFSYKYDVVLKMLNTAKSVTLIDHHASAIEDLAPLIGTQGFNWYCDIGRSGAGLAWTFLHADRIPLPPALTLVEDRDLWKFLFPETRAFNAYLFAHEYTWANWYKLMAHTWESIREHIVPLGNAIEMKHWKDVRELVELTRREVTFAGHTIQVANLPYTMSSDAAQILAENMPFGACYWDTESGRNFSLRSAPTGLDVSKVAMIFGGGGHKHAAGFRVPRGHPLALF